MSVSTPSVYPNLESSRLDPNSNSSSSKLVYSSSSQSSAPAVKPMLRSIASASRRLRLRLISLLIFLHLFLLKSDFGFFSLSAHGGKASLLVAVRAWLPPWGNCQAAADHLRPRDSFGCSAACGLAPPSRRMLCSARDLQPILIANDCVFSFLFSAPSCSSEEGQDVFCRMQREIKESSSHLHQIRRLSL